MMKDELRGKIMTEFVALRAKTYSYLDYDGKEENKGKEANKCFVKKKKSDYKTCLFSNNPVLRSQEVFKSEYHDVYTLRLNKIPLTSKDDIRLQTYDKITTYPYVTVLGKLLKQSY